MKRPPSARLAFPEGFVWGASTAAYQHAPGRTEPRAALAAVHHLLLGHGLATEALRRLLVRHQHECTGPAGVGLTVTVGGGAADDVIDPDGTVHDPERRDWLDLQLRAVHRAVTSGVDVRGCFVASFVDGFEWTWGYTRPLGLIHPDHDTMRRTPKASGYRYAQTAAHNAIQSVPLTPVVTQEGPRR